MPDAASRPVWCFQTERREQAARADLFYSHTSSSAPQPRLQYLIQWHLPPTRDLNGLISRFRNTRCVVDSRWNIAFTEALNRRSGETRVHPYDYMRKLDHAGLEARRKELYDTFWKPNGDLDNPAPHWFSAEIRDEHDEVVRQLGHRWATL